MSEFIGSTVKIKCPDRSVIGRVKDVTDDLITLVNVTCDDKNAQHFDSLVLRAENILDLALIAARTSEAKSAKAKAHGDEEDRKLTRCAYVCPTTPVRPLRPMRILKAEDDAGKMEGAQPLAAKGKSGTPQKGARERSDTGAGAGAGAGVGAGANAGKPFPRRRAFSANYEGSAFAPPDSTSTSNSAQRRNARQGRDTWYQVDVTELKEEFDFEGNLRQFNKTEFYRQVDERRHRDSPDGVRSKTGSDDGSGSTNGGPRNAPRSGPQRKAKSSRQDCFEMDVSQMLEEFDFESNLAQFNKSEFYREVDQRRGRTGSRDSELASKRPDVVPEPKYRHDENVLASNVEPALFPVRLPASWEKEGGKRFMAPDNVLLPACPAGLRRAVFSTASSLGLTWSLVTELFGRSVAELVLEQVGGRTRLRPGNEHQLPHVLVLAGPHLQGALGVALARHLWSRRCRVTLVAPQLTIGEMEPPEEMEQQLELFRMLTGETVHSDFDAQPSQALDFIVSALECHIESKNDLLVFQRWMPKFSALCNANRPPCLVVDPPAARRFILPRIMVGLGLPLPIRLAEVNQPAFYLCDVGLTPNICKRVGISYASPFGCRSLLQLRDPEETTEASSNST